MQAILRAFNRWTVLAALLLGTLFAINARVTQISVAGGNTPVFAATGMATTSIHANHHKQHPR